MPRQKRIEYAGAIYHAMSRGDRREPIFLDDGDRHDFLKTVAGPNPAGQMRQQAYRAGAEGIIEAELRRSRWKEGELSRRAKRDPGKLALAARLRRETALTIQEIADRLQMGSRNSVAPKLHTWRKANE